MKKLKSAPLLDEKDFPISRVRRMLVKGTGTDVNELKTKPMIAIVNSHTDLNPGHMHLNMLAEKTREGILTAGGIPFEFNVPAPCDGMTEGHEGMRYILPQRELIADIVETYIRSMLFDGMVMIASCDKIIPGMIMAAARLDLPMIFLTGGPGCWQQAFTPKMGSGLGNMATCGACDLMGTANTFQCLAEVLGLTLPWSANVPGFHADKLQFARQSGKRIVSMVEEELTTRRILTRKALENAVIMDLAIGGSTNSTLHLPAIARELDIQLPLSVFNEYNQKIPTLLGIRPNGPHGIVDLYSAGGIPAVMKNLADDLHLDALTVTGETFQKVVDKAVVYDDEIIPPRSSPHFHEGGTAILYGNIAPDGAVVKQSAVASEMMVFKGTARVLDAEADVLKAFREGAIQEGQVLVIRYEGPKGGPGMPETLAVTMALESSGLKRVALITDGRFSGASTGPCVGHVSPETYVGGPIAALQNGDEITIDIPNRKLNANLEDDEIKKRLIGFTPLKRPVPPGFMQRYIKHVHSAAEGATLT